MQKNSLRLLFPQLSIPLLPVYLDSAATSHKPVSVIERVQQYYLAENANVHRSSHIQAAKVTKDFEAVRQQVQHFIGAASHQEIIWTKGATESINLVASCLSNKHVQAGQKIVISALEHHANLVPWQQLALRFNLELNIMPIDDEGVLLLESALAMIDNNTAMVALAHVSNALGNINPIEPIIAKANEVGALSLIDGTQAVSHLPVNVQTLNCDFYVFSGHKMYGPTGIGVLYGKLNMLESLTPYQFGGEMIEQVGYFSSTFQGPPYKFEAGTPNIAGVMGLGAAVSFMQQHRKLIDKIESQLYTYLLVRLSEIADIHLWGDNQASVALQSFTIDGFNLQDVSILLSEQNIALRAGHHCAMPLMQRLGLSGTLRVSLACYNTFEDIDQFIDGLKKAIEQLKQHEVIGSNAYQSNSVEVAPFNSLLPLGQNIQNARGWDNVYRQIMLAGKDLIRLPENLKDIKHEISGCESQVWLACELRAQKVYLRGDSSSKIVRGLLAVIFEVLNGQSPHTILHFNLANYLQNIGLSRHLSPSRGNGLLALVKKIQQFCESVK